MLTVVSMVVVIPLLVACASGMNAGSRGVGGQSPSGQTPSPSESGTPAARTIPRTANWCGLISDAELLTEMGNNPRFAIDGRHGGPGGCGVHTNFGLVFTEKRASATGTKEEFERTYLKPIPAEGWAAVHVNGLGDDAIFRSFIFRLGQVRFPHLVASLAVLVGRDWLLFVLADTPLGVAHSKTALVHLASLSISRLLT